ncbi:MAG: cytochrome P460 family protein [Pseudomonadota bacterium]
MRQTASKRFAALGALLLAGGALIDAAGAQSTMAPGAKYAAVDDTGGIRVPDADYRKDWTMLGTYAVAEEEGKQGSQGLHMVYAQPEAVAAYREHGKFPDGTVLVKELFSTKTEDMTTGTVSRAAKTTGWFVMVKDAKGRFADHKLWGDGWGWAYFDAEDPNKTTSTDYEADCKGCHVPAQATDWVFVQGYPVLTGK